MTTMIERYLLDTGILLRLVSRLDPEHATVRDAVQLLRRLPVQFVTCYQNLAEFWNVFTRPVTPNRTGFGRTIEDAKRCIHFFRKHAAFISETEASGELALALWEQHRVIGTKTHDTRIAAVAIAGGVTKILTLNPADFRRYAHITVVTPADVLAAGNRSA